MTTIVPPRSGPGTSRAASAVRRYLPGLGLVAVAVAVAYGVSEVVGFLGPLSVAIVLGVVARNANLVPPRTEPALGLASKRLLRAGVVLLGLQLAVPDLLQLRPAHLLVIAATVVVTFAGTRWLGHRFGLHRERSMLLATGFSICGAAAIAAMNSVVEGEDDDVATAVALVTLYGGLAIAVYPLLQGGLGLSDHEFGIWVGASVHEVAQVVAAAAVVGEAALIVAVVAKLARVVLLAPMVAAAAIHRNRHAGPGEKAPMMPLFVLGFAAMVVVRSLDVMPSAALDAASSVTTLLLTAAMFALGTGVHIGALVRTGGRAMLVGGLATLLAAATAYAGLLVARL